MTLKFNTLALALMLASTPLAHAAKSAQPAATTIQQTYSSPEEASKALVDALRAESGTGLLAVVGPASKSWLASGDEVADRGERARFVAAYEAKNSIRHSSDNRAFLLVGQDDWPFPAPIVRRGTGWAFDANAGREELINRRVGRNELETIQTLLSIVNAQREYAAADLDGNGSHDYARRILSTPDTRNGLYWPVSASETPSPLGPLIAAATREGYGKPHGAPKAAAYHGYRFRLLTAQGKAAPGGAYSYLVGDKLIGGFSVVAYPARYGISGLMTLMVAHDGVVWEKNLGGGTEGIALKMTSFNPDGTWRKSR